MLPISIGEHSPAFAIGKRTLVLCVADCHFGAEWIVRGLRGEILNRYNPEVFAERMDDLLSQIRDVITKEGIGDVQLRRKVDFQPEPLAFEQRRRVRCDNGIHTGLLGGAERSPHIFKILLIEDDIQSQIATQSVFMTDAGHFRQILRQKIPRGTGTHIKAADAEIDRIGTPLDSGLQAFKVARRRHDFQFFPVHGLLYAAYQGMDKAVQQLHPHTAKVQSGNF